MEIRVATLEDARQIAGIQVRAWQAAYRDIFPAAFLDRLDLEVRCRVWGEFADDPAAPIFVADGERGLAGFCHLLPSRDEDGATAAEIASIYVDPPEWGLGFGRSLMSAAVAFARDAGFGSLTLWVLEENLRARAFYETANFRPDNTAKTERIGGCEVSELRYRLELLQHFSRGVREAVQV